MSIRITLEPSYGRGLKALPPERRMAANEAIVRFQADPSWPRLPFRPLKGCKDYFVIDPTRGDRIILRRDAEAV